MATCCEQCDSVSNIAEYWWIEAKNEKWTLCEECGIAEEQEKVGEEEEEEEEDQDDFTNRMCEFCGEGFDLSDPHYYDEEDSVCYCSEVCFRKEKEGGSEL